MRADGHTAFRVSWTDVKAVRLLNEGRTTELVVDRAAVQHLQPTPPVLTAVAHESDRATLRLDLSETDVPRDVLLAFLRRTSAIPDPDPVVSETDSP
jgi:hypothetical protein